jgi:D-3-phosphoglycerate dehydrogenase / 2-oxoglutarate reductase
LVLFSEVVHHASDQVIGLEDYGFELVDVVGVSSEGDEAKLIETLDQAWGVIAGAEIYSRRILEAVPTLRVIARTGSGFDTVDLEAATEHGIAVLTTPGANAESVADFTLALTLACLRRILEVDDAVRSGTWRAGPLARDLFASTVGLLGFGHIGQAVARRLRGFECRLLAVESLPDLEVCRELGVELMTLNQMLPQVDVLSLHLPLTAETTHIIGDRELQLMQPHSVVINTARGGLIDGLALGRALRGGTIASAGLDVFEHEPLQPDAELARLPNVVLAGHVASFTVGALERVMSATVAALIEVAEGGVPLGCINPTVLRPAAPNSRISNG